MTNAELVLALAGIFITVIFQALYIAYRIGRFEEKLTAIEKKQDKHNNVIERTVAVEQSVKSAHNRLDDGEKHFETLQRGIDEIKNYLIGGNVR